MLKLGTWHFRVGMNKRGNYKPRWFWRVLFAILVLEMLYNLISLFIASPLNALMVLLLLPMVFFIWTRLWFIVEIRAGSDRDRDSDKPFTFDETPVNVDDEPRREYDEFRRPPSSPSEY